MLTLVSFSIGNKYFGLEIGRTMAFLSIGFLELVHSINVKNEKSIFETGIFENKYLVGSFVLGVFVQAIVVIIPFLAKYIWTCSFKWSTMANNDYNFTFTNSYNGITEKKWMKLNSNKNMGWWSRG